MCSFSCSLQLHHETIHEAATYGSVRPYRESPLLARARQTESFHSYRDFQSFSFNKNNAERVNLESGSLPAKSDSTASDPESCVPDKKPAIALKASKSTADQGVSDPCRAPEPTEVRKKMAEEENEPKAEMKRRSGFDGAFLGRRKVSQVPHLSSSPGEGGSESSGTASPSPTKSTTSPRRKKSDSSCQDYAL